MKWEGDALLWAVEQVRELGDFPEANWNHRSIVEVPLPRKSEGWFLHAMTGHEAYFKLVFRLPGRPFRQEQLAAKLALRPLSDTPGLEGYSRDANRVEVTNFPGGQQVVVVAHKKAELDTPAFREFLKQAVDVVQGRAATAAAGVEGNMPWKKDGEKWHLGDKGFPPGQGAKWDRTLLPKLVKLLREVDPGLEWKWDVRDAVTAYPKGASRFWCRVKTKERDAMEVWFAGRPGTARPARFQDFGREVDVEGDRADGVEILKLKLVAGNHLDVAKLKPLLAEHLAAFKEAFGGASGKEAG
jgi:excinuclease ABC subunit A